MLRTFHVEAGDHPFGEEAREILASRIEERSGARRGGPDSACHLILGVEEAANGGGFRVSDAPGGARIVGHSCTGLLAGVGKFLRTSQYGADGFIPSSWRGESSPAGDMRGVYFATHFQNWYHVAPEHEIARYIKDLSLWGVNHLMVAFPIIHLTGWDDPEADTFLDRVAMYRRICGRLGIRIGSLWVPNQDFREPRHEFAGIPNRDDLGRKGDHGNNVCPSEPGATEYLLRNYDEFLRRVASTPLDFTGFWPYDEGGCGCEKCYPWGGNGYLRLARAMAERARAVLPGVKLVLSTWVFDTPEAGEWAALSRSIDEHGPWVDYILADAHEDFPRYPLDVGVPGNLPLVNFPEISMWGLSPWGGFGANPLPDRFQRLWGQVRHVVRGGFPYSEGIYEDINKAIATQFYWDPARTALETLREYAAYEFPGADADDVRAMIGGIETNHAAVAGRQRPDLDLADEVAATALRIDGNLAPFARTSWRWRILYLRAVPDRERYAAALSEGWPPRRDWGALLASNPTAQEAFRELMSLYHCPEAVDASCPQHAWVRPPAV